MDADRLMFLSLGLKNATATHDAAKARIENLHEQIAQAQQDEQKAEGARREAARELSDYVLGIQRPRPVTPAAPPMPPVAPQPVPWGNR